MVVMNDTRRSERDAASEQLQSPELQVKPMRSAKDRRRERESLRVKVHQHKKQTETESIKQMDAVRKAEEEVVRWRAQWIKRKEVRGRCDKYLY